MKYEEDLAPYQERVSGWRVFFVMLILILSSLFCIWIANAAQAAECDTATDAQLDTAIASEPSRLLAKLKGEALTTFIDKLRAGQYLVGTLDKIDSIYIVTTKDGGNVMLMFFVDHCLIRTIPASRSIVEALLK